MLDGEETEGEEDEEESGRGHPQVDIRRDETRSMSSITTAPALRYSVNTIVIADRLTYRNLHL